MQKLNLAIVIISCVLLSACDTTRVLTEAPFPKQAPKCFIDFYEKTKTNACVDRYIDEVVNEQQEKLAARNEQTMLPQPNPGKIAVWGAAIAAWLSTFLPSVDISWGAGGV